MQFFFFLFIFFCVFHSALSSPILEVSPNAALTSTPHMSGVLRRSPHFSADTKATKAQIMASVAKQARWWWLPSAVDDLFTKETVKQQQARTQRNVFVAHGAYTFRPADDSYELYEEDLKYPNALFTAKSYSVIIFAKGEFEFRSEGGTINGRWAGNCREISGSQKVSCS